MAGTMRGPAGELRIAPQLPAHAMKTYELRQPLATHFRVATCAEVDCPQWAHGWQTGFDLTDAEQVGLANWVRNRSGLIFTFVQLETRVVFSFPQGQQCLRSRVRPHRLPLDRDPIALVRGGDWRGNPRREGRKHVRLDDWVDDFASHQDRLATRLEQG
jgi:hypothetical protein